MRKPQQIEDKSFVTTNLKSRNQQHQQWHLSIGFLVWVADSKTIDLNPTKPLLIEPMPQFSKYQCPLLMPYIFTCIYLPILVYRLYLNSDILFFFFKCVGILTASLWIGCTANIMPAIIAKLS